MPTALYYPKADRSRWYGGGNATVAPTKVLWHTTETPGGCPGYAGGTMAPNLTYDPFAHRWWQHFPLNGTARALKNGPGYSTNRQGVVQVEVSCYCDPARMGPFHVSRIDQQAYDDMGDFSEFMRAEWGVPLYLGVRWKPYPSSYGANGVRFGPDEFRSYAGHCAHQNAPYNLHGDAGTLDGARILAAAPGGPDPELPEEETDVLPKIITAKDMDDKTGGGDFLMLATADGRFVGLQDQDDINTASRYVGFAANPADGALYQVEVAAIRELLSRAV